MVSRADREELTQDPFNQDIGVVPTCLGLPKSNGDCDSQASIDYDHGVELPVSSSTTSRNDSELHRCRCMV